MVIYFPASQGRAYAQSFYADENIPTMLGVELNMQNVWKNAITKIQAIVLIAIVVVAVVAGVAYYYLTLPRVPTKDVYVGILAPLTGGLAYLGDLTVKGMGLAVEEINAAGGIKSLGGANISLVVFDSGASAEEATLALRRMLILHPGISAVFQPWPSGYLLASAPIAESEKIPMFCTSWTNGLTESGYKYIFRVAPKASDLQDSGVRALLALGEARTGRPMQKIAFAYDDNPLNADLMKALKKVAADLGKNVVLDETWKSPMTDATSLLLKVASAQPDVFFCYAITLEDAYLIVRKFTETGLNRTIPQCYYGGGLMSPDFLKVCGEELVEGKLGISDWNVVAKAIPLEEKYKARYGEAFLPKDAALAYGTGWIIKEALEKAGSTNRQALRTALTQLNVTTGNATVLWGPVSFKSSGDINLGEFACVLVQWQSGELKTVFPEDLATAEAIWPTP